METAYMYKSNFPPRIKAARKRAEFTQAEVQALTGISRSSLSKYENGEQEPPLETLGVLTELYGVSADWLLGIGTQAGSRPNYDVSSITKTAVAG